jgi:tetratricopeptide (TPR) repeat protein
MFSRHNKRKGWPRNCAMTGMIRSIALVLALSLCPVSLQAQSDELMAAYRQYVVLLDQGRYADALPFAHRALELGERKFGADHATTATLIYDLAEMYRAQGRYAEAEPLYLRALAIPAQP